MLDKWQKKEKPVFTGITRGLGGFGFGGGGVIGEESGEIQQLKVIHSGGSQEDISQLSSYSFQDGDIIEPILGDYTITIKCAGKRGLRNGDYTTVNVGYGAWVQGTINMRYGAKYYVRISDGIGAIYWGDSGAIPADNDRCMMLGAEGGYGKRYFAGFYDPDRDWADDLNALGLGGNAGVYNPSGSPKSGGSTGQGSPGVDTYTVDANGGSGGSVTLGHGSSGGSGGSGGTATGPNGARTGGTGGYFTRGTVDWTDVNINGGGEGGMGYFGGGGGGSVLQHNPILYSGGGGGGGASYAGGVPNTSLINPDTDDASVSNISSGLNNDPATETTAFVKTESTPILDPNPKEERYWEGFEYGGAVAENPGDESPFLRKDSSGLRYGFYTRTGTPEVESGDFGGNNGIREREITWDGVLVHNTGDGSGTNPPAEVLNTLNANGWVIGSDDYAYSWVDIITKIFPNSTTPAPQGSTSSGTGPVGSYYPWDGDQCNCFNVMRVDKRYAELYTADQLRPIVIQARLPRISGTSPNDSWPEYFASNDPV